MVTDLEEYDLLGTVRIQKLERERSSLPLLVRKLWQRVMAYNAAEERPEQRLRGEVVAHFLQTEQNAANRSAEGHSNSTSGTGAEDLSAFSVIVAVLGKDTTSNVSNTGGDVYLLEISFDAAQCKISNLRKGPPSQDSGQMQHSGSKQRF